MAATESARTNEWGGAATGSLLTFVAAFAVWASAYLSGAFPWLGYAWLRGTSTNPDGFGIVGETRSGTSLGATTFLFFEGQEIVIDYDAEIRSGALWLYVYRPFDGVLGDGVAHYVTETGSGTWAVRVAQTGIHSITIEPTASRGAGYGWDLNYTAWWGARQGG